MRFLQTEMTRAPRRQLEEQRRSWLCHPCRYLSNPPGVVFIPHKLPVKRSVSGGWLWTFDPPLPPAAPLGSQPLGLAFDLVTGDAQHLRVAHLFRTAIHQRDDVVTLPFTTQIYKPEAVRAMGVSRPQRRAQCLALPTADSLGLGDLLGPCGLGMLGTTARAIAHQCTAAGMTARAWGGNGHGVWTKKNPDKRKACRGSHRVHRGWRRNTHTVPVM